MVDHVPRGPPPPLINWSDDRMSSGPANKSGEFKLRRVSQLERDIAEYLGLRRSMQQREIPYQIRSIAEKNLEELGTNMKSGSIDIYQTFIEDYEQLKHKHPEKTAFYDEKIEEYSRLMANIERARRVVAGAER